MEGERNADDGTDINQDSQRWIHGDDSGNRGFGSALSAGARAAGGEIPAGASEGEDAENGALRLRVGRQDQSGDGLTFAVGPCCITGAVRI